MGKISSFYLLIALGVFACSCSQILLKKSAMVERKHWIFTLLNPNVIVAYTILLCSMFVNIYAMSNGVGLKDIPILESLGYVFVPILSYLFLNEKINKRTLLSILLIFTGICVFYL